MKTDLTRLQIQAHALTRMASAATALAKWKATLETSPLYAFDWSGDAFLAAGALEVWATIERWAEQAADNTDVEFRGALRREALRSALIAARPTSRSTSATSNLAEDAKKAAWLGVFEYLGGTDR